MSRFLFSLILTLTVALLSTRLTAAPTNDGIYADMHTTAGTIELELYYTNAPRTVANFMSLIDGSRSYVNFARGGVSSNDFYNGIIFHRVVSNFVIQAGSPNQQGNDGPGYTFGDEFDTNLTHTAGALSMANSGPDSNGSQFFITAVPTAFLDGDHTIFGQVVTGMDIVSNINHVVVDVNDRPLVDVVITNITLTRNGTAANAFSTTNVTPQLPHVRPVQSSLGVVGPNYVMTWTQNLNCEYWPLATTNLLNPTGWARITSDSSPSPGIFVDSLINAFPYLFFTAAEIEYFE